MEAILIAKSKLNTSRVELSNKLQSVSMVELFPDGCNVLDVERQRKFKFNDDESEIDTALSLLYLLDCNENSNNKTTPPPTTTCKR